MYLMEGRKLLDVQGSLQTFFSVDFWEFCFSSHFYTCLVLNSMHSFCRKNDSQFDRKKELEAMREEREWFFVYPWHRLFIE